MSLRRTRYLDVRIPAKVYPSSRGGHHTAYCNGALAHFKGRPREANPYRYGSHQKAWDRGWCDTEEGTTEVVERVHPPGGNDG